MFPMLKEVGIGRKKESWDLPDYSVLAKHSVTDIVLV